MTWEQRPMSETFPAKPIFFHKTPEGHVQDYHTASRRQLIFLSSAILELETGEGLRTIFRPGDRRAEHTGRVHKRRTPQWHHITPGQSISPAT